MKTDISLLFEKSELDTSVILTIQPLAPLSMVSSLPGSYYKTERIPTKFMLSGLFENLLGWHFSKEDRANIFREMKRVHKKKFKKDLIKEESKVGYQSLVSYYFEPAPPPLIPVIHSLKIRICAISLMITVPNFHFIIGLFRNGNLLLLKVNTSSNLT